MNGNPYEVLGITASASDDEVKRAYRELSRKYHPDSYADNPLADLAEEKFKQVQEAYDEIMKMRSQGGSYGYSSYSGSTGRSGSYSSNGSYGSSGTYNTGFNGRDNDMELQTVYSYIVGRQYRSALNALNAISNRNARWFYYSAIANAGLGNNILSLDHAKQASMMEPSNPEYSSLVSQLQYHTTRYQSNRYGNGLSGIGNLCCDLWCADTLCECMGGDLIRCI